MPTQRIESTAGSITVWGSCIALLAELLNWMEQNVALITTLTLLCGFFIQLVTAIYNRRKSNAEEQRAQEKHNIEMAILRGEMVDRRSVNRDLKNDA